MDNNINGVENVNNNPIPTPQPVTNDMNAVVTPPLQVEPQIQPTVIMEPAVTEPMNVVPTMQNSEIPTPPPVSEIPQMPVEPIGIQQSVQTQPVAQPFPTVQPQTVNQPVAAVQPQVGVQQQMSQQVQPQPIGGTLGAESQSYDEEYLKAFIGKNYDKITTRPFNFAGFFFSVLYMFYRKMFLYAIVVFLVNFALLNLTGKPAISILLYLVLGFFVNKLYVMQAKQKIAKIKAQNPNKDFNGIRELCSSKGGTSVGQLILGIVASLAIGIVISIVMAIVGFGKFALDLFNFGGIENPTNNGEVAPTDPTDVPSDALLLEDVKLSGHGCWGNACTFYINSGEYKYNSENAEYFKELSDYDEYLKVDIYYEEKNGEKIMLGYKIFKKSTNEDITSVKDINSLREKLGLYALGTQTDTLTLIEIGDIRGSFSEEESYTYRECVFENANKDQFEMEYRDDEENVDLVVGNQYTVQFEVVEGTFEVEYKITSIN